MRENERCCACGVDSTVEELYEFDGHHYCYRCLNERTVICEHCGARIYDDDNVGDENLPLCSRCYESAYTTCCRCGRIIHDYYYKPEPIFYGEGSRYFGIELEVDDGGELDSKADAVLAIANTNCLERIYAKHDGSLSDGWEAVSHPATLEYHLKEIPWSAVLDKLRELGYTSHQARTCGLHIHVNRTAFGSTVEMQDECIARILYLFEKFWPEILKFSRRTQRQLDRWASRYGFRNKPKEILDHAKYETGNSRYTCVNLTNEDTIEIRVFRGTLKYNTFVASLQFVDRLCDLALFMSDEELENMSWSTFALGCTEPELVRYLKERQLYIIAVQLLEDEGEVNFKTLARMAEKLEGTFTITVLDKNDSLYFVRGDNPMCISHFPGLGIYLYASTREILADALAHMPYRFGKPTEVFISCGEILKIECNGKTERAGFDTRNLYRCYWQPYTHRLAYMEDDYIEDLKAVAGSFGYSQEYVDFLLGEGLTPAEVEEVLYGYELAGEL